MKYFSEITQKLYDSEELLQEAEKKEAEKRIEKEKKDETRKKRAAEVEEAMKEVVAAKEKADRLMGEFVRDYGSFHYTYKSDLVPAFDRFFSKFF